MSTKSVPNRKNFYESCEEKPVEDLVEEYLASGLDPYDTDIDMLHLRARLQNRIALEAVTSRINFELGRALDELQVWLEEDVIDGQKLNVEDVIRKERRITELKTTMRFMRGFRKELLRPSDGIVAAHGKVIKAAQTRAETRALEEKAKEPGLFVELLEKLMTVLREELPPELFQGLMRRMEQDLDKVPESLKTRKTSW